MHTHHTPTLQGGTNFRVLRVVLSPGGKHEVQSKKYALSPELYQGHGAELFLFLAQCIKDTIVSLGDDPSPPKPHHLGFTFSFPCDQTALDAGRLVWWTKGFTWSVGAPLTRQNILERNKPCRPFLAQVLTLLWLGFLPRSAGVEGEEVVGLLQKALSLPEVGVKVHVEALVNDTVGTLMAKKRSDPVAKTPGSYTLNNIFGFQVSCHRPPLSPYTFAKPSKLFNTFAEPS
jgi:hypothetical protein